MIKRTWKVRVYFRRDKCRCGKGPIVLVFDGESKNHLDHILRLYRCRSCALKIAKDKNLVAETENALRAAS